MNYIARLQTEFAAARADALAKAAIIQEFRVHLASDMFAGLDADGGRKDWIAIGDVHAWLSRVIAAEG